MSERDPTLREARIAAFKSLIRARVFLTVTGDVDLMEDVEDAEERLEGKIRDTDEDKRTNERT